eukprot:scaffold29077_cov188-Skeletonema_menzelii.AAC.1
MRKNSNARQMSGWYSCKQMPLEHTVASFNHLPLQAWKSTTLNKFSGNPSVGGLSNAVFQLKMRRRLSRERLFRRSSMTGPLGKEVSS